MPAEPDIVKIAALVGDQARAAFLLALMSGRSLTATELAGRAGITKQTASAHLSKLLDAKLIAVESQGRHRYFRLADADIAQMLEHLLGVASRIAGSAVITGPRDTAMRKARVCYDHLAGELGVSMLDSLVQQRLLSQHQGAPEVTPKGWRFFHDIGLDIGSMKQARRPLCRTCLDWSMRRRHLAGLLGASLLEHFLTNGWARRKRNSRAVDFTVDGERRFRQHFRVAST